MGKLAFLFAGQGAQAVGMGADFYRTIPAAKRVFDLGEQQLPGTLELCFSGDPSVLNQTEHTQPCLYLTDLAIAKALETEGLTPEAVAGFSLGEIPAAAFAGIFSTEDGFRFVAQRGLAMAEQSRLHPGAMAAVLNLRDEQVEQLCGQFSEIWPVNYNCPGQVACAGSRDQIDEFCKTVRSAGGRAIKLPVSGAFHTPYLRPVVPKLERAMNALSMNLPERPIYANRTGAPYSGTAENTIENLSKQVASPVLWRRTLERMWLDGIDTFVEVGPGHTLSGFVRKTLPEAAVYTVPDVPSFEQTIEQLRGTEI